MIVFEKPPKNFDPKFEIAICFCEHQGKILLLHRQDHDGQGNKWSTPGGGIEPGETPLEAMVRELKEETGLLISPQELKYLRTVYVRYPEHDYILHKFYLKFDKEPKITLDKDHQDYRWVEPAETLEMDLLLGGLEQIKLFLDHDFK